MTCKFVHYMLIYVTQYIIILSQKDSDNKMMVLQECFSTNLDLWTDKNEKSIYCISWHFKQKFEGTDASNTYLTHVWKKYFLVSPTFANAAFFHNLIYEAFM